MIRIKFEVEEEETPLPIESINVGFPSDNNVVTKKLPEKNVVVAAKRQKKVVPKKKLKLDNSTTDSVASLGLKSIKTEPAESLFSSKTSQLLNQSLNIPNLPIQNCSHNFQTINSEFGQSIQQQQQEQSITNETFFPIKIELTEKNKEVPLSLDQSSFLILNSNSGDTTTATNCDAMEMYPGPRAGFGRKAKLNICYKVPKELKPVLKKRNQHSGSSTEVAVAAPSPPPEAAVLLLVGKKPLPLGIPPLTLEEKKARQKEYNRISYLRKKTNLKSMDPETMAEIRNRNREYHRGYMQQFMASVTPEQLEQKRLKGLESYRRYMENESEKQRQRRLEQRRQYDRTVAKQRLEQKRQTPMTPEEREKKRVYHREYYRRYRNWVVMMENNNKKKKSLEESQIGQSQTTSMMSSSSIDLVDNSESSSSQTSNHHYYTSSSMTSMTNDNNNGIVDIGTTISKTKRKPPKKRLELSMSIDSDSSHFDIDGQTITTLQSPKPGPSMKKLPRPTRCQIDVKSMIYFD